MWADHAAVFDVDAGVANVARAAICIAWPAYRLRDAVVTMVYVRGGTLTISDYSTQDHTSMVRDAVVVVVAYLVDGVQHSQRPIYLVLQRIPLIRQCADRVGIPGSAHNSKVHDAAVRDERL
jgi:hypothetical protein